MPWLLPLHGTIYPDGGACHFAETIRAIRSHAAQGTGIEVLIPDFQGSEQALADGD